MMSPTERRNAIHGYTQSSGLPHKFCQVMLGYSWHPRSSVGALPRRCSGITGRWSDPAGIPTLERGNETPRYVAIHS